METIRKRTLYVGLLLAGASAMPATADPIASGLLPEVDTSSWDCRMCPIATGWWGDISLGLGNVSRAEPHFGNYTGLDDKGLFVLASADLTYRNEDAQYLRLDLRNLGLDSRYLQASAGHQGRYGFQFTYDELPRTGPTGARTLYRGSSDLQLPAGWVPAATTGDMVDLQAGLRGASLGTERQTLSLRGEQRLSDQWRYGIELRRREQDGERALGALIGPGGVLLPAPVARVTDQMHAHIAYLQPQWQLQLAYHGSFFSNDDRALRWENPFNVGPATGQLALEPDNSFNQLLISGNWRANPKLRASGRLAVGRMEQDESFLTTTVNPGIITSPLPRDSLNARVDTLNAQVRLNANPRRDLALSSELYYDERDNKSPRNAYEQVYNDFTPAGTRFNRPYSFERSGVKAAADYRAHRQLRVSGGASLEYFERSYQAVRKTETTSFWGELRSSPTDDLSLRAKFTHERRVLASSYNSADVPEENPLMRKFHLAGRDRNQMRLAAVYQPLDKLSLSANLDYADDDYNASLLGLQSARELSTSLDANLTPSEHLLVHAFVSNTSIKSVLAGSNNFAEPDWRARQQDSFRSLGLGLTRSDLFTEKLDAGIDYSFAAGRGAIRMRTSPAEPGLPNLENRLHSLRLHGHYRLSEQLSLRLEYWYERYKSDDFYIDNVQVDSFSNLLTLGQRSPNYSVNVLLAGLRYSF